jgi:hypothetical protein
MHATGYGWVRFSPAGLRTPRPPRPVNPALVTGPVAQQRHGGGRRPLPHHGSGVEPCSPELPDAPAEGRAARGGVLVHPGALPRPSTSAVYRAAELGKTRMIGGLAQASCSKSKKPSEAADPWLRHPEPQTARTDAKTAQLSGRGRRRSSLRHHSRLERCRAIQERSATADRGHRSRR